MNRTSLTPFAKAMQDPDPTAARRFCEQVYLESGIIIILPSDVQRGIIGAPIVEGIERLLYGRGKRR